MAWEDHEYALIAWKQTKEFGHHNDLAFGNPDWSQLASAFGWDYHWVSQSSKLRDSLESAFDEEGPSLIALPIDYRENLELTRRLGDIVLSHLSYGVVP